MSAAPLQMAMATKYDPSDDNSVPAHVQKEPDKKAGQDFSGREWEKDEFFTKCCTVGNFVCPVLWWPLYWNEAANLSQTAQYLKNIIGTVLLTHIKTSILTAFYGVFKGFMVIFHR